MSKVKKILKSIYKWFVYSSANPKQISLTLKAGLPFLVFINVIDATEVDSLVESIVSLISAIGMILTGILTAYGLSRKIANTLGKKI